MSATEAIAAVLRRHAPRHHEDGTAECEACAVWYEGEEFPNHQAVMIAFALPANGYALVGIPAVGFKGPHDTDASLLRGAADKAESARYPVGGSNVGRAVAQVLREVADQATRE